MSGTGAFQINQLNGNRRFSSCNGSALMNRITLHWYPCGQGKTSSLLQVHIYGSLAFLSILEAEHLIFLDICDPKNYEIAPKCSKASSWTAEPNSASSCKLRFHLGKLVERKSTPCEARARWFGQWEGVVCVYPVSVSVRKEVTVSNLSILCLF